MARKERVANAARRLVAKQEEGRMPGSKASEDERQTQILEAAYRVAARDGLGGLTGRKVAAEAGLSSGLVFFHYKTKEALLVALLDSLMDWLVGGSSAPARGPAADRFVALVRRETDLVGDDRRKVGLVLEYWALGARRPALRDGLRETMARYRTTFRASAEEVVRDGGLTLPGLTADGLAAIAASLAIGNALQQALDPEHDVPAGATTALDALLRAARSDGETGE